MLPGRVSNPGPLTYESGALPIALRGPARTKGIKMVLASALPSAHLEKLVPRHGYGNRGSRESYVHSSIFDDCMMPLN